MTNRTKLLIAGAAIVIALIPGYIVAKHMIDANEKFDLDCTQARSTTTYEPMSDLHFRVDLAAMTWCSPNNYGYNDCKYPQQLKQSPGVLWFVSTLIMPDAKKSMVTVIQVDRKTGQLQSEEKDIPDDGFNAKEVALCHKVPTPTNSEF